MIECTVVPTSHRLPTTNQMNHRPMVVGKTYHLPEQRPTTDHQPPTTDHRLHWTYPLFSARFSRYYDFLVQSVLK